MSFVGFLNGCDGFLESDIAKSDDEDDESGVGEDRNHGEIGEGNVERKRNAESGARAKRTAPVEQVHRGRRDLAKEAGREKEKLEKENTENKLIKRKLGVVGIEMEK